MVLAVRRRLWLLAVAPPPPPAPPDCLPQVLSPRLFFSPCSLSRPACCCAPVGCLLPPAAAPPPPWLVGCALCCWVLALCRGAYYLALLRAVLCGSSCAVWCRAVLFVSCRAVSAPVVAPCCVARIALWCCAALLCAASFPRVLRLVGVCCVCCAVLSRLLLLWAALCCSVSCGPVWCCDVWSGATGLAVPCCFVLCFAFCPGLLLRCYVLFASRFAVSSWSAFLWALLCLLVLCCAALRLVVPCGVVQLCTVLCA